MVDHVGVIVLLVVLLAVPAFGVIAARVRAAGSASPDTDPDSEGSDPVVGPSLLGGVLVYLMMQTLALLWVLWALAFQEVGLVALGALLIPALIGLVHAWWVGALTW